MIKEALQYLIGLGNTRTEDIDGQKYSTQPMHLIPESTFKTIELNSLGGFVDYIKSDYDVKDSLMVHVASPTEVNLYTHVNRDAKRDILIQAKALLPTFQFGKWYDTEEFNIKLQSVFVDCCDRATILGVVGNIKDENVTTFGDDGVSQKVTAKTGVATVGEVKVPNPVFLAPYRTFIEVQQPASAFVFRMQSGPSCALFEADGGAWRHEAMSAVYTYLKEALAERIESGDIVLIA